MTNPFLDSLWPGLALWVILYISDYALTVWCARIYRSGVSEKLVIEGSYELTPQYQADIDALRLVSPRFLLALVLTSTALALLWWLASQLRWEVYEFGLGALILLELVVHVRHFRNLFMFRAMMGSDAVRGRIEYSRPFVLRMSAVELFTFAGLFAFLFAFTQSWFFLGGALSCLSTGEKHRALAKTRAAGALQKRASENSAGSGA
jgi:hypothetical protein